MIDDSPTTQDTETIHLDIEDVFLEIIHNRHGITETPYDNVTHPLIVNARITCKNNLYPNGIYLSVDGIEFVASGDGHTLINKLQMMDKFVFPKEVMLVYRGYLR